MKSLPSFISMTNNRSQLTPRESYKNSAYRYKGTRMLQIISKKIKIPSICLKKANTLSKNSKILDGSIQLTKKKDQTAQIKFPINIGSYRPTITCSKLLNTKAGSIQITKAKKSTLWIFITYKITKTKTKTKT